MCCISTYIHVCECVCACVRASVFTRRDSCYLRPCRVALLMSMVFLLIVGEFPSSSLQFSSLSVGKRTSQSRRRGPRDTRMERGQSPDMEEEDEEDEEEEEEEEDDEMDRWSASSRSSQAILVRQTRPLPPVHGTYFQAVPWRISNP